VTTLRDVNNAGFLHRERARFRAGTSALLGIVLDPPPGEGAAIEVADLPELRRIESRPGGGASIGAFVTLEELSAALPDLCPPDATLANVRMRLALHDARLAIAGLGNTRSAPIDAAPLAPHELPVTIEIAQVRTGLGIAERRRVTNDGDASFAVGVTVALRVSRLARFEHVRIMLDLDGAIARATLAERRLEGERCDRDLIPEAARLAAASIPAADARSSAVARALFALVLAALRDAFDAARRPTAGVRAR